MGITAWKLAILPVSFTNSTVTHQRTLAFYQDMFLNPGKNGLLDYWEDVSRGLINFTGSQVFARKTFPGTVEQFLQQVKNGNLGRGAASKLLVNLFTNVDFRTFSSVIVIPDMDVQDVGAAWMGGEFTLAPATKYTMTLPVTLSNVDLLGKDKADANFFAHEVGHNFGLLHASAVESGLGQSWVGPMEYCDPFDVMGGTNPHGADFKFKLDPFTLHGIALSSFHLQKLGWLPDSNIKTVPMTVQGFAAGVSDQVFLLDPLYGTGGTSTTVRALRITFTDVDSGMPQEYWVELRAPTKWDQFTPATVLLIRRIVDGFSYLLHANLGLARFGWINGEVMIDERNNIRIEVDTLVTGTNNSAIVRVGSFVNRAKDLGPLGNDIVGGGFALTELDQVNLRPDLVVFGIENKAGENQGFLRTAANVSDLGVPPALGAAQIIPAWGHLNNQKGDIAMERINAGTKADAMILFVDDPDTHNIPFTNIGMDVQVNGAAAWQGKKELPRRIASRTQGAAVCFASLDTTNATPDVIAAFAALPAHGKPWLFYRVGKDIGADGSIATWGVPIDFPKFPGHKVAGIGIAVADLRKNGKKDMVVFVMDQTHGISKGYYAVGSELNASGVSTKWSEWIVVPGTFGTDCRDVSIKLSDHFSLASKHVSMLIFTVEKASGSTTCNGHLRLMRRVKV
jgi:hypothetical protein